MMGFVHQFFEGNDLIVLIEIGLTFEQSDRRGGGRSKERGNAKVGLTQTVIYLCRFLLAAGRCLKWGHAYCGATGCATTSSKVVIL